MPDERRAATVLAFIRALEASAQDDVLDLFDLLVTRLLVDAVRKGREARLRSLRDLETAQRSTRHPDISAEDWPAAKEQATGQRESKPTTERTGTRSHVHLSATNTQRFILGGGATIVVASGSVSTTVAYDTAKPKCPKCGSEKVAKAFSAFYARTSKKS